MNKPKMTKSMSMVLAEVVLDFQTFVRSVLDDPGESQPLYDATVQQVLSGAWEHQEHRTLAVALHKTFIAEYDKSMKLRLSEEPQSPVRSDTDHTYDRFLNRCLLALVMKTDMDEIQMAEIFGVTCAQLRQMIRDAKQGMYQNRIKRALIIEDEALLALGIKCSLEEIGVAVTGIAPTLADALLLAAQDRPDIVLADVHLADHSSGLDAVRELRDRFPDIAVVFITSYSEAIMKGQLPPKAAIIPKPYRDDQLTEAMADAVLQSDAARHVDR